MFFEVCYKQAEVGPHPWESIPESELRSRLAGNFRDVDAVIESMREGQVIQTNFAFYRAVD